VNERLLIVEDDVQMAQVLQQGLENETYRVAVANDGWKGLELARKCDFDAILLDVMLPSLDGYSLARQLRADGIRTPILMLTALDSTSDIVTGLDAGAEGYLSKPFSFVELLARIRALVRRGAVSAAALRVGDLTMDTAAKTVSRDGRALFLTKTEYLFLEVLMRNAGHVVSREEISKALWGERTVIEQNSIDVHVRGLRTKVDQASVDKLIHTVRGFGYKLEPRADYL
jgi:two-component system response regulator MprA